MDGVGFHGGEVNHQPRHSVCLELGDHPPTRESIVVTLGEGHGAHRVDHPPHMPAKRSHRFSLGQREHPRQNVRAELRLQPLHRLHQDLRMLRRDARPGEGIQRGRVPVYQRFGAVQQLPRRCLGDAKRRGQLQPHRPINHLEEPITRSTGSRVRVKTQLIYPNHLTSGEHAHHHLRLYHQIYRIRHTRIRHVGVRLIAATTTRIRPRTPLIITDDVVIAPPSIRPDVQAPKLAFQKNAHTRRIEQTSDTQNELSTAHAALSSPSRPLWAARARVRGPTARSTPAGRTARRAAWP